MIYVQNGLYVTIEEDTAPTAPLPKPLQHGFSQRFAYLVLGAFSLAESGEAYFIMGNDRKEIWFISNRHLRVHQLLPGSTQFRLALAKSRSAEKNGASSRGPAPRDRRPARSTR